MARIVIVRSNPVDPDSRVEKEANTLSKFGHSVKLLVWDRDSNHRVYTDEKKLTDVEVKRIRIGAKAAYGAGMKSLLSYMSFQLRMFFWLLKNRKEYDVCHFCDFDTAFFGSISCLFTHKKFIFDIFDYLSTDAKSKFQLLIKRLEDGIIEKADATIICTEQRMQQIAGTSPRHLAVIHNSPPSITVSDENVMKKEYGKCKVGYVGILQDYRLIKEMINAISKISGVELHIGGFGKYESYVKEMSECYDNIIYYGKLSYEDTIKLESECDMLTAIYDPQIGNHIYAAPNKFYEGLMLGKPLIMVKGTGMSPVVEENKLGILIDYSEEGFAEGLCNLIGQRENWSEMSMRMKQIYEEQFSWNEMERRLVGLYEQIM